MKKVVFAIIICTSLFLGACKEKTVTTKYSIGCLGFSANSADPSDWTTIENYFSSTVTFNTTVTFENTSEAQNDKEAKDLYNAQIKKLDSEYVCSLLKEPDFYIYGIYTLNPDGTHRILGALRFDHDGTSEVTQ